MKLMTMIFEIEGQELTLTSAPDFFHAIRAQVPSRWKDKYGHIQTPQDATRIAEVILARTYDFDAVLPADEVKTLADALLSLSGSQ